MRQRFNTVLTQFLSFATFEFSGNNPFYTLLIEREKGLAM